MNEGDIVIVDGADYHYYQVCDPALWVRCPVLKNCNVLIARLVSLEREGMTRGSCAELLCSIGLS